MLKRPNRLKSRGDFKRTLAGQRLCANDCFALYGLSRAVNTAGVPGPRIGFIISKKVHKRAVVRNRIRRRLRELLRTSLKDDRRQVLSRFRTLVLVVRSGSVEASFQTLSERMDRCFQLLKKAEERC